MSIRKLNIHFLLPAFKFSELSDQHNREQLSFMYERTEYWFHLSICVYGWPPRHWGLHKHMCTSGYFPSCLDATTTHVFR